MTKAVRRKVPIIGLNGPPRCGKGYITQHLVQLLPHATVIKIQDGLFRFHQDLGHAKDYETYEDWKRSPDFDRDSIIRTASLGRAKDDYTFVKICESLPEFKAADVVIFDNIGFPADNFWARRVGEPYLLLRIDTEYNLPEPAKAEGRRFTSTWKGDSRRPFVNNHMLTAYDSLQMSLLLEFIASPKYVKDGGPYHEYDKLWSQFTAKECEPVRTRRRPSGKLGGLDV